MSVTCLSCFSKSTKRRFFAYLISYPKMPRDCLILRLKIPRSVIALFESECQIEIINSAFYQLSHYFIYFIFYLLSALKCRAVVLFERNRRSEKSLLGTQTVNSFSGVNKNILMNGCVNILHNWSRRYLRDFLYRFSTVCEHFTFILVMLYHLVPSFYLVTFLLVFNLLSFTIYYISLMLFLASLFYGIPSVQITKFSKEDNAREYRERSCFE